MKKWKVLVPCVLAAGAAAALLLAKKPETEQGSKPAKAENTTAEPKNAKEGSYSFVSGYKDPKTVELTLRYDAERFGFAVISEEFLSYSSDSHVAVLRGEDYAAQFEYAAYYPGEDFAALSKGLAEKYKGFTPAVCGENAGVRYRDGDNFCFCFPIPGDAASYLLVTLIRVAAKPEDFEALPESGEVGALLASLRFRNVK
ncbi:MAG: hypothetical protein K6G17_04545 [Oscillospiraceae bacterium]|nr:hypothetical protein [Oscillospiraceae bacterium]